MEVTICIGTFGEDSWIDLAGERAIPSARAQGVPVLHYHRETLAQARNAALTAASTERVIFLDADDELDEGYVEALSRGSADVRAPAVSYVKGTRRRPPYVPRVPGHEHDCEAGCLRDGNWLVIGSSIPTKLAREVGGFKEWPIYEDWCLFQRLWLAGASFEAIPEAVYLATWRADSRNRAPEMAFKNRIHREIVAANFEGPVAA